MKCIFIFLFLICSISNSQPPIPQQKINVLEKHGDKRLDEYFWMKERKNPKVLKFLKDENKYLNEKMKPSRKLQKDLFSEMKSRVKQDDSTYPVKDGSFYYYTRYEKGRQYPIYARNRGPLTPEQILFNINTLAKGHSFFSAHYTASPNHHLAALTFDTVGRRFYNIHFKDLRTGKFLKNEIKNVTDNIAWANDNRTLFYVRQHPDTLRWFQIYSYNLDHPVPVLVYEEKEDSFEISLSTSLAKKHIFITSESTLSTEVHTLDADHPELPAQLLLGREKDHEFSVTEDEQYFYFITNKNARDFKVLRTTQRQPDFKTAEEWLGHRNGVHIDGMLAFKDYVALASRENGLTQIEVINKENKSIKKIDFQDSAYSVELGANEEYDSPFIRYVYNSLRNPPSVYDYELTSATSLLRKIKEIPNYDSNDYVSERVMIKARDGALVPVSILRKKSTPVDGSAGLLVYGYGSYGSTMDPWFSSSVISLVDRGFIYAIAHVRGGGEMGREWTDNGRTLKKKNTFFDFIDSTEYLVKNKYADPKKVFARGGSAGGLLMGAIANFRPDLYCGIVAEVPFVDVITTMLDDSIPLTTAEYDEWGNPNEKKFYDYIKTYSPYDNVSAKAYPNILVTTGLFDSQVQYWEPAKWVARLQRLNTSNNVILLKTDMEAGHGGKTGRFDQLKEESLIYAFVILAADGGLNSQKDNLKASSDGHPK